MIPHDLYIHYASDQGFTQCNIFAKQQEPTGCHGKSILNRAGELHTQILQFSSYTTTSFQIKCFFSKPIFVRVYEKTDFSIEEFSAFPFCKNEKWKFIFPICSKGLSGLSICSGSLPNIISISPVTCLRITWTQCIKGFFYHSAMYY